MSGSAGSSPSSARVSDWSSGTAGAGLTDLEDGRRATS